MPGANFNSATVSMTRDGAPVTLSVIHPTAASPAANYGDPTIVWEPQGLPAGAPDEDIAYVVTVSGIQGGSAASVTYTVTVINPYDLGVETALLGPEQAVYGEPARFAFDPTAGAIGYTLQWWRMVDTNFTEGAEAAPAPRIIAETDPSYELLSTALARSGTGSFHVAFPHFTDQRFEFDRTLLPRAGSTVSFAYRRRFSSTVNRLHLEASADEGGTWTSLWSVAGICSSTCNSGLWDAQWNSVTVPLASFADRLTRLRFRYAHNSYGYIGVSSGYGMYVDDISVAGAQECVDYAEVPLDALAREFALDPSGVFTHRVRLRVQTACAWFDASAPLTFRSVPRISVTRTTLAGPQIEVGFAVEGGTCAGYQLLRASSPTSDWTPDNAAVLDPARLLFRTVGSPQLPLLRVTGTPPYR
jgi:hypothetical protein